MGTATALPNPGETRIRQNEGGTELGNMHSIHSETLALVHVTKFMGCITERGTKGKQSSEQN